MDLGKYHLLMRQLVSQGDPRLDLRARLVAAAGPRPSRELQLALIELARGVLAETIRTADKGALPSIADAHDRLSRLGGQAPTYNFDPAILLHEIGNLLAGAAPIRETANG
jgi:DNA polymerase-3 subunit delta'